MPRRLDYPRGHIDVECLMCGSVYEFWNHEMFYEPGVSDRCPVCGAVSYRRAYRSVPQLWDRVKIREEIPWYYRDRLDDPHREPMSYNEARARAVGHWQETGEYVTPEDILKEVNTVYYGFYTGRRQADEKRGGDGTS